MSAPAEQPPAWGATIGRCVSDSAINAEADYQVLLEWARRVVPNFTLWPHTERIMRAIAPAVSGVPVRSWLAVPPRFGKTEIALVLASWFVCNTPTEVGYAAYGDDLAVEASERCQAMVRRAGKRLTAGRARKDVWTVRGGGLLRAGGIGGGWHGKGIDLLIADDLIKGSDEARNGALREKAWQRFMLDIVSRRSRPEQSGIVGIGTRWHPDDPGGRIIDGQFGEPFDIVTLPALSPDGVPLCPELLPLRELERIRRANPAGFWSLYMQDPRPDGMGVFVLQPAPIFEVEHWRMDGHRMAIFCDPAATAKTHSDRSAFGVCAMRGVGDAATMDVVEAVHARLTPPQLAQSLVSMWKSWRARGVTMPIGIEALGTGIFLPDLLRSMAPELASYVLAIKSSPLVKVTADKYTRAQPVARAYNEGRVRFAAAAWTAGAVAEILAFTGLDDPHDDFVDFIAHGWNTLYRTAPSITRGPRTVNNLSFG